MVGTRSSWVSFFFSQLRYANLPRDGRVSQDVKHEGHAYTFYTVACSCYDWKSYSDISPWQRNGYNSILFISPKKMEKIGEATWVKDGQGNGFSWSPSLIPSAFRYFCAKVQRGDNLSPFTEKNHLQRAGWQLPLTSVNPYLWQRMIFHYLITYLTTYPITYLSTFS